jgi:hypothetical protein
MEHLISIRDILASIGEGEDEVHVWASANTDHDRESEKLSGSIVALAVRSAARQRGGQPGCRMERPSLNICRGRKFSISPKTFSNDG